MFVEKQNENQMRPRRGRTRPAQPFSINVWCLRHRWFYYPLISTKMPPQRG